MKKISSKKLLIALLFICLVAVIGISALYINGNQNQVYATSGNSANEDGKRIANHSMLEGMTVHPEHDRRNGCGLVAMSVLLQFYNDLDTQYQGQYIPVDTMNYKKANGEDQILYANNLRDTLDPITPKILNGWFGLENATEPSGQAEGLTNYLNSYCPNVNANVYFSGMFPSNKEITDLLDRNIPVILTMLTYDYYNDKNEIFSNDIAHSVVAYGYKYINGRIHYLTHFGWSMDEATHYWVTESSKGEDSFIFGYCNINAPLSRFNTSKISEGNAMRIDGLVYNHTGTLTIPSMIDDLPVKEIGDNAFRDQDGITDIIFYGNSLSTIGKYAFSGTKCKNIVLPPSLTSIKNNAFENCLNLTSVSFGVGLITIDDRAFANCINLTSISSLTSVQKIGNECFKNCSSLSSISLPKSLISIGIQVFANCSNLNITVASSNPNYCAFENVLYNKDKTQIIATGKIASEIVILDSVIEILPYAFDGNQNLNSVHFEYNPKIGDYAFYDCINLKSVYFYSYERPTELGINSFTKDNFVLYAPYTSRESYQTVFAEYTNQIDSIKAKISYISCSEIINSQDFYFGSTIENLYIPSKVGYDFNGWYDNPEFTGLPYQNGGLWNTAENVSLYAKWDAKNYTISFSGEQSGNLKPIIVTYDKEIGKLPLVEREGYTFLGWKSQNGEYFNDTVWTGINNITLTSDWIANDYNIIFDGNGGTPSAERQVAKYNSEITSLADCERIGYSFKGWNVSADGSGQNFSAPFLYTVSNNITLYAQWEIIEYTITYVLDGGKLENPNPSKYTILSEEIKFNNPNRKGYDFVHWKVEDRIVTGIPSSSYGNLTVTAYWQAKSYTITLDANGGSLNGENTLVVSYDSSFSTSSKATRVGYTFEGWYDGNVKYITSSGEGNKLWDKTSNTTLYAHWAVKSYEIQINDNGTIIWLGASGLSNVQCSIEYGTTLNAINLIAIFKQSSQGYKEGKIFDHFEYNNSNVTWTSVPDLGENGAIVTIVPIWILEEYTIYFNTRCDIVIREIIAHYGESITLPNVERSGYTFNGWYYSMSDDIKLTWTTMPDLTLFEQGNGSIALYAQYNPISYSITYHLDGGTNAKYNTPTYTIEDPAVLYNPTKIGYVFQGWFLNENFTISVIEFKNTYGNKEVYAKWSPVEYNIVYHINSNTASDTTNDSHHVYNTSTRLRTNTFTKVGYHFIGWATTETGEVVYQDSQFVINLTSINNAVVELYAVWEANTYTVHYNANGGIGTMNPSTHTIDIFKNLNINQFTRVGYIFEGWAISPEEPIMFEDGARVKNLIITDSGHFNIFAKWTPQSFFVTLEKEGGTGGSDKVFVLYESEMTSSPYVSAPSKQGSIFQGYYSLPKGGGTKYYNADMTSSHIWNKVSDGTLYAYWLEIQYNVTLKKEGGYGGSDSLTVTFGSPMPKKDAPLRDGFIFQGYFYESGGYGFQYYDKNMNSCKNWDIANSDVLYAYWLPITYRVEFIEWNEYNSVGFSLKTIEGLEYGESYTLTAPNDNGTTKVFEYWMKSLKRGFYGDIYAYTRTITIRNETIIDGGTVIFTAWYSGSAGTSCVAEGTLITLADGTQKAVENLTGSEQLLVWNLFTGSFDTAPILFIDHDPVREYEVISLMFSDGTTVKVISEHGFWDFDLNEYVFLRRDAAKYIGHWFNKQTTDENGNFTYTRVQLTNVIVQNGFTSAWSPVTYGHLCYYVNGMLSMPGATTGLINTFNVDTDTMKIDETKYLEDIAEYGLFTYEEFAAIYPVPEVIFEAFGGQYLKVAMGKGLIDSEMLGQLIASYAKFFG